MRGQGATTELLNTYGMKEKKREKIARHKSISILCFLRNIDNNLFLFNLLYLLLIGVYYYFIFFYNIKNDSRDTHAAADSLVNRS